jgi:peptidoglycan/LPS O-acetylase OafA/YrhL
VPSSDRIIQAHEVRSSQIEGLRAVGALSVLVGHMWFVSELAGAYRGLGHRMLLGFGFGAYMLLALSGYLLALPFLRRDYGDGAPVDLRRYARNRVLRIVPLYYTVLVVVMVLQEHGGHWWQWWRFATFSQSFSHYTVATVDGPMWTLVAEIHFYLLLPVIAWLLARACRGRLRLAVAVLLALTAASVALWEVKVNVARPDALWQYSTPAFFFFFTTGMLVAATRLAWERRPPRWLDSVLGRADAWFAVALGSWVLVCWHFDLFPVIALSSFLTIGALVLPLRRGVIAPAFAWRWVATIGVASYSLYLWHYPIVTRLAGNSSLRAFGVLTLTAGTLSVAVALVSYRVVEAPFLGLRRRWSPAAASQDPSLGAVPAAAVATTTTAVPTG